jgi:hypothetical protein
MPLADDKPVEPGKYDAGKASYTLVMDSMQSGVEERYFSILRFLQGAPPFGLGYKASEIEKVKDIYTAGETSSYWGAVEQKKAAQIDKFQQLMANVGNMVKTLFQLIRELRIMEERLEYYDRSNKGEDAAEVALKSVWVDMVEGGAKNPGSVTGLAANVGFVTLPDLFYAIHPKKIEDVEREVGKLKESFNRKVREVLSRKLKQYLIWKEKTYQELKTGQVFKLKYLRQHYHVIKIYLNWLRPYLRNIKRLQMKGPMGDHDIVAAFDTSKIELEVLAMRKGYSLEVEPGITEDRTFESYFPCVRVRWTYVAIPQMAYQQEYQRGAIHTGRTTITIEGFVTSKDDLKEYKKKLDEEDFELIAAVDESLLAMKDDIDKYLTQAGEIHKKEEEKEEKRRSLMLEPFIGVGSAMRDVGAGFREVTAGFKEMFGLPQKGKKKEGKYANDDKSQAKKTAGGDAYVVYTVFKKTHGMMSE